MAKITRRYLTDEERQYIIDNYGIANIVKMTRHLNMQKEQLQAFASNLRKQGYDVKRYASKPASWTNEQEKWLIENYKEKSFEEMEEYIEKPISAIKSKIFMLRKAGKITEYKNERTGAEKEIEVPTLNIKNIKVNLKLGQVYKVQIAKNEQRKNYIEHFEGIMVQDNKNTVVLKHKMGYCETFLKSDLLIGEYKFEEVKK